MKRISLQYMPVIHHIIHQSIISSCDEHYEVIYNMISWPIEKFHKEKINVLNFLNKYINSIMNQYLYVKNTQFLLRSLVVYSLSVLRSQDSELCADFCQKRNRGHHYGEGVKPDPGRLHFSDHLQVLVGLLSVIIDVDRDHTLVFSWFFCRK